MLKAGWQQGVSPPPETASRSEAPAAEAFLRAVGRAPSFPGHCFSQVGLSAAGTLPAFLLPSLPLHNAWEVFYYLFGHRLTIYCRLASDLGLWVGRSGQDAKEARGMDCLISPSKVNPYIFSLFLPERAASFTLEPSRREAIYTPVILTTPDLGLGSW